MHDPNAPPDPKTSGPAAANGAPPEKDAASAVLEDLEGLRARAQERDQFLALLQRTQADFENYRKRNQPEREQEARFAHSGFARDLLPVLDNLDRATAAARQAGETGPLVQGVALVQAQLLDLLKRYGVTRIDAEGKPFDPNLHQAVMQQPAAGRPPDTVVQVLEQGFMIHDRGLRPARGVVAAPEKMTGL